MSNRILETARLTINELTTDDAEFILELLNDPSFIRYIGDKGIRSVEEARRYLLTGPVESYIQNGYGLYLVKLKGVEKPIGICGL
jgi:ribosomal-protein-alanine N-acetyltransferase